jgi:hypothetical protein
VLWVFTAKFHFFIVFKLDPWYFKNKNGRADEFQTV